MIFYVDLQTERCRRFIVVRSEILKNLLEQKHPIQVNVDEDVMSECAELTVLQRDFDICPGLRQHNTGALSGP